MSVPAAAALLACALSALRAQSPESLRSPALPSPSEALQAARQAAAGAPAPESSSMPEVRTYSALQSGRYPGKLGREELQRLVQAFVDQNAGKAFRTLGDPLDFDHGHFLYPPGKPDRPIAILYHTQERACNYGRKDLVAMTLLGSPASGNPLPAVVGGAAQDLARQQYDYVDKDARNWIQWVDDPKRPSENARKYERKYPDTEESRKWQEKHLGGLRSHFSINDEMLDAEKLGMVPPRGNTQFSFTRVDCRRLPRPLPKDAGILDVFLPLQTGQRERERVCLVLGIN